MIRKMVPAVLVAFATSSVLFAAVIFDPDTGTGFVGKGDVQLAFGWNNKQLQENASEVTFKYEDEVTYAILCEQQTTQNLRTFHRSTGVLAQMDGDPRQTKGQKQFTGFILSGWDGDPELSGDAECPGGFNEVSRELVEASGGGLKACYGGTCEPLQ